MELNNQNFTNPFHPDNKYIHGLRNKDEEIIKEIHLKFQVKVMAYIHSLGSKWENVKTIYDKTFMEISQKAISSIIVLKNSFLEYMKQVAKKNWDKSTQHPDHRYIQGLVNGNHKIIKEIVLNYKKPVIRYIQSSRGSQLDGEDMFQDALKEIFENAKKGDFILKCPFLPYIKLIAHRKWIGRVRMKVREREIINEQKNILDITTSSNDDIERMKNAMAKLPPDAQKVLRLYYYQNWCIEAIEKEMGYSPGFGRVKLHRCREKLRNLM